MSASTKSSSIIAFVLGLVAALAVTGCGDNIHPGSGMLPSPADTAKDITQFTIDGVDGSITGTSIALTLPFGTDRTRLTPTIVFTGVSVSPDSGVTTDFTSTVPYTVTAADGSTQTYFVQVSDAASSAKDITHFTILGVEAAISGTNIALTLPFGTDVTSLTPTITITGVSVSPSGANDFTSPAHYTVTAADGSTKTYTATVNIALDSSKDITQFTILGVNGAISGTNISLTLPFGTDPTSLTPTITITGVSVSPASGVAQDFSGPVMYTVTAADATTKTYTVTVTIALNDAKDITQFTILGVDGAISGTNIALTLPFGTDPTSLTPTITITGMSVSPASGVPNDFSVPAQYVVTAQDGTTKTYTVTVTVALNDAKDITKFTINGVDGAISGTNISLTLPFGTDPTSLTPTVTITGVTVSPASGVAQDFSVGPVMYTVTAQDATTKSYSVVVTIALDDAKDITKFTIDGVDGTIAGTNISLTLPFGTDPTSLTPTVTITGVSVSPASGVAQDFSAGPVSYTVTAQDATTKTYTVTVTVALNDAKDITGFTINGVDGVISGTDITLTLPFGTSLASLSPTVTITGVSVNPASGTAQDFSSPVMYTVTAQDTTTKTYTVTVNLALNDAKDITQFTIDGFDASISGTDIELTLPMGTSLTSLTPTITITGASVSPASGVPQDFSAPVTYIVTAADGTTQTYTATVTDALGSDKDIIAFSINGVDAVINGTGITLTLPFGTDLTSLAASVTITGVSVSPASGALTNFSGPVVYTVTAADHSTKAYTVTVSLASGSDKDIIRFTVDGLDAAIATTSPTTGTIALDLPKGTNLASLVPTVTITGVSVSPKSGVAENFSGPVQYVVTAADGTTKTYTVTIGTVNGVGTKLITDFSILGVHGSITNGATSATITLTLPHGTDLSAQTPIIITNASSLSPPSFVARDFTNPVTYTVTAANGSTRVYTVTVTVAP